VRSRIAPHRDVARVVQAWAEAPVPAGTGCAMRPRAAHGPDDCPRPFLKPFQQTHRRGTRRSSLRVASRQPAQPYPFGRQALDQARDGIVLLQSPWNQRLRPSVRPSHDPLPAFRRRPAAGAPVQGVKAWPQVRPGAAEGQLPTREGVVRPQPPNPSRGPPVPLGGTALGRASNLP
jgi:hypothetical protein